MSGFHEYWHGHPVRVVTGIFTGWEGQADGTGWGQVCVAFMGLGKIERIWFEASQLERLPVPGDKAPAMETLEG